MVEVEEWPGLWICPDYLTPVNFKPPFKFKCHGMIAEKLAVDAFKLEMVKQIAGRN